MNSQLHSSAIQPVAPESPESRPPFNEISVLFPLLSIYTAGYMGLMVADFALKNDLDLSDGIMPLYIALLGAYAADKEASGSALHNKLLKMPEPGGFAIMSSSRKKI